MLKAKKLIHSIFFLFFLFLSILETSRVQTKASRVYMELVRKNKKKSVIQFSYLVNLMREVRREWPDWSELT